MKTSIPPELFTQPIENLDELEVGQLILYIPWNRVWTYLGEGRAEGLGSRTNWYNKWHVLHPGQFRTIPALVLEVYEVNNA